MNSTSNFNCNVNIGGNCVDDTLTVDSKAYFNCDTYIGNECTDTLTVNSTANFLCNTNLGDDCGDVITVDGQADFNCKTTVTNCGDFYLGTHSVPCPGQAQTVADGDSGEVLLYNNGGSAILEWHTYTIKEIGVCDNGVTTNYKFLTLS